MQQDLQQLARELRKETCPQRVLDEVARRISEQAPVPSGFRRGVVWALAVLALFCGIALWQWRLGGDAGRASEFAGLRAGNRAQVAMQAEGALGYIGRVLLDASARSEGVVLKEAVPPLRNGLESARNKLVNQLKL